MDCDNFDFLTGNCTQVDIGFDFEKVFTYTDSLGLPVPLTGFDFNMIIKDALGGATLLTLPTVNDNVTTGFYFPSPITGIISMLITDTDTAGFTVGTYPYEMTITDTDSKVEIFMQGEIQFVDRGF